MNSESMDANIMDTCILMRRGLHRDMHRVIEIEREAFEFPWSFLEFQAAVDCDNTALFVAEHEGEVVGFIVYQWRATVIKIHNIAVAKAYRRMGIGYKMMTWIKRKLRTQQRTKLFADVRDSNLVAQMWMASEKVGFICERIIDDAYPDDSPDESAYRFVYRAHRRFGKRKPT